MAIEIELVFKYPVPRTWKPATERSQDRLRLGLRLRLRKLEIKLSVIPPGGYVTQKRGGNCREVGGGRWKVEGGR